ncbi:GNAT domain [Lasallia pustulata]|uniref:GNAT domain n=1 Tax=Lasallia pustulata TaxID=136370 RepID=A0A1W5DDC3_9LECA|nr:GNAT domain [Lasallia pustulata]
MELSSLSKPPTTTSPPSRVFRALSRLLPSSAATTKHTTTPSARPLAHSSTPTFPNLSPAPTFPSSPRRPSNLTLQPLTPSTLPAFKRLTAVLFPIRYPDKFYTDALSDPAISSLSRIAIWRSSAAQPGKRKRSDANEVGAEEGKVVGLIRCRLEPLPSPITEATDAAVGEKKQIYLQTLGVLSPYRTLGVASALLDEVVGVGIREFGITAIYAHVWEANSEALEWYVRRGFAVEDALVEGYYRRLRPAGARVVRRVVGVEEYLRVGKKPMEGVDEVGLCGEERGDGDALGRVKRAEDGPWGLEGEAGERARDDDTTDQIRYPLSLPENKTCDRSSHTSRKAGNP